MRKRAMALGMTMALLPATAHAASELSVTNRLDDRRVVAAGTRAYSVGFADGRFYATGSHIAGEMSGVWAPPLKLVDGVWFAINDTWIAPATGFTSGRGYVRYSLPSTGGLLLRRTDFVPDGRRAALFGLELANASTTARTVTVKVQAHSELLSAYPWSASAGHPTATDNVQDHAAFRNGGLRFTDSGTLPGRAAHDYAALVASDRTPTTGNVGPGYRGPQAGTVCQATETPAPSACDDGPVGKGAGGELRYRVTVAPRTREVVWIAVAGSDRGLAAAQRELAAALRDPDAALLRKQRARTELANRSRISLPANRQLQEAVNWAKQNLADLTQTVDDLRVRFVDQGRTFPSSSRAVSRATFFAAGFPDAPWLLARDGEYAAYGAVALGQFETAKRHLIALRDVSDAVNGRSGKVAHEVVTDGSVVYGANADAGDTDESARFPSAVATVWRWTGDNSFRNSLYDFSRRSLRYVVDRLDADGDGWPEGLGAVERAGTGEEKLDTAVALIGGLYDFADMARSRGDTANRQWATTLADRLRTAFEATWWANGQYADSRRGNEQITQRFWTGVTPMAAELTIGGRALPGLADAEHAATALDQRQDDCYSGTAPFNLGLFHTGCPSTERTVYSLVSAVMAVGEGNYGRLARDQQRRYTNANAAPMLGPDEMPGALPEILPSPDFGDTDANDRNLDRCWTCRAGFMSAAGHYGIAWPVIHQQLGVRPSLGTGRLEVVPQLPTSQTRIEGSDVRIGAGDVDVRAERRDGRYTTTVTTDDIGGLRDLRIGATLPAGTEVGTVTLDGERRRPTVRTTNRGVEVTVRAPSRSGRYVVVVAT